MAKVKYTAIVAQMVGKLAGSVFARGRFGNYIRTLTSPINSHSPSLERVRSLFSKVVTGWYNLTDDQREAWNSGAALAGQQQSFGASFNYTGRVMYIHVNRNLQEIGETMLTTPPVMVPAQSFNTFSVDIDETVGSEDIKMSFDPAISADTKVIVYATPILGRGQVSVSPRWYRKIAVLDDSFLTGSSIMADYLSIFKTMPAVGERVGFKMKSVAISSGKTEYPLTNVAVGTV